MHRWFVSLQLLAQDLLDPPLLCCQVNTLFPSPRTDQGIKGGVVLLRMGPPPQGADAPLRLTVTYTDRSGQHFT
jgi:hypothetical protein